MQSWSSTLPIEPCPCEAHSAPTSPGPVLEDEILVRFVEQCEHVVIGANGDAELTPTAVRQRDLQGKGDYSFSTVREAHIEKTELVKRAIERTSYAPWKTNPVIARGTTKTLRQIADEAGRREVCVNSDPTGSGDPMGACPAHTSVVRSNPPRDPKDRKTWWGLRVLVAASFNSVAHADQSTPQLVENQTLPATAPDVDLSR